MWLLDDLPVYGRELDRGGGKGKMRRDAGFFVLVVAEVHWDTATPVTKLRVARAMPKSNTPGWRLVFDELRYRPDFIVADAGTGILAAIRTHFGPDVVFVPSLWHLTNRIERALVATPGATTITMRGRELVAPLAAHMRKLSRTSGALADAASWSAWWDDLDAILVARRLPRDGVRTQRKNSERPMMAALPALADHPRVPVSTGGLETLIGQNIEPLFAERRRSAFGNIERTNGLLDLAIARHHGAFDDLSAVAAAITADTSAHGGWTVPLRSVADARPKGGHYSSLRDATLLADIAAARGLT